MKMGKFYLSSLILLFLISCSKDKQFLSESELNDRWSASKDIQDYIYWVGQNVENTLILSQKFGIKIQDISQYASKCSDQNYSVSKEALCYQLKKYETARNNLVNSRFNLKTSHKELVKYREYWVKYVASKMPSADELLTIRKEANQQH